MHIDYTRTCSPRPDGHKYEGWHRKSLVVYEELSDVEAAANRLGMSYFFCEYGSCYHLCR